MSSNVKDCGVIPASTEKSKGPSDAPPNAPSEAALFLRDESESTTQMFEAIDSIIAGEHASASLEVHRFQQLLLRYPDLRARGDALMPVIVEKFAGQADRKEKRAIGLALIPLLTSAGADITAHNHAALRLALWWGSADFVRVVLNSYTTEQRHAMWDSLDQPAIGKRTLRDEFVWLTTGDWGHCETPEAKMLLEAAHSFSFLSRAKAAGPLFMADGGDMESLGRELFQALAAQPRDQCPDPVHVLHWVSESLGLLLAGRDRDAVYEDSLTHTLDSTRLSNVWRVKAAVAGYESYGVFDRRPGPPGETDPMEVPALRIADYPRSGNQTYGDGVALFNRRYSGRSNDALDGVGAAIRVRFNCEDGGSDNESLEQNLTIYFCARELEGQLLSKIKEPVAEAHSLATIDQLRSVLLTHAPIEAAALTRKPEATTVSNLLTLQGLLQGHLASVTEALTALSPTCKQEHTPPDTEPPSQFGDARVSARPSRGA